MRVFNYIVGIIIGFIAIVFASAWMFMMIWNFAVVSAIAVTKPISFWVAFWLVVLLLATQVRTQHVGKER